MRLILEPTYVGCWVLGSTNDGQLRLYAKQRPLWLHRLTMRLLLGITWEESNQ